MSNDLERADASFFGFLKTLGMNPVDRKNLAQRGVIEYQPAPMRLFFDPSKGVYNSIVSGGLADYRNQAIVAQTASATHNNFPVVIFHEGNYELEQALSAEFGPIQYVKINASSPYFEPFVRMNADDISRCIAESVPSHQRLNSQGDDYIGAIYEILVRNGQTPNFRSFATIPYNRIFGAVEQMGIRGLINEDQEEDLKSRLMEGQSEKNKIRKFFSDFSNEANFLLWQPSYGQPWNILNAIENQKIISVDLSSFSNHLLLNLLVYQLKLAQTRGFQYTLIVDEVPFSATEQFLNFIKNFSKKNCYLYTAQDFYAMTGADPKLFSAISGKSEIKVVMGHESNESATKWADVFGQYNKLEQSDARMRGKNRRAFHIFADKNNGTTTTISKARHYKVDPEFIVQMANNEAYIQTRALGELVHLFLQ